MDPFPPSDALTASEVIALLNLAPHPEGGHYRETFRDSRLDKSGRAASSLIYFLLSAGELSAWHQVDAVEIWHWHAGAPTILTLSQDGRDATSITLGPELREGQQPHVVVPAHAWQTASSAGNGTLVSCTVAPAFEFAGFELAPPNWHPE